ncbi:cytochrome c-type biogenesis protein CcmI [Thalassovita gelatinovora]|uniref:Cytochrome c-type biogenesis protein CcmI n=1 Tax=Thalassovita gelatinovora TaxID=53501 RepID=A0A0N7LUJ9_THAGE|nr:c-type cytochrome biogenesis protein CcmI [Thalassovita gelatinovora]QIZ79210.1 c-type cytochrome biogenesis protein CcmI [Thalassovita gelatinovora]CUH63706.1 cytochrome c-type biogenesis protein CcmI [Thalassovita gelatinovora]SER01953.1 cytochrome c-type biogenesis protein CcmH [Thalassovita gelatinovora]
MLFWIITAAIALSVSGILAWALLRGRTGVEAPAAFDLRVYRDQLKEVDRDLARGVIGADDAERARAEISRRILNADTQLQKGGETGGQPKSLGRVLAAATVLGMIGGSLLIYLELGVPGYGDFGLKARIAQADETRQNRPGQAAAEAAMPPALPKEQPEERFLTLMEQLRAAVAQRPNEVQGLRLLARNEATLGNYKASYEAQQRLIEALGDQATARDYTDLADTMILTAGGYVSPEAEAALMQALKLDPRNGVARYYMGLMFVQVGRPDASFQAWNGLLREGPADAPWIAPIRAQIPDVARLAGVDFTLPATAEGLKGPSAADMQAAGDMSAEERQDMIRGMVANLSERLATEGGAPEEWARLIGAYGVLGETDRAREIWTEAQQTFADKPEALAVVRSGAERAGVLQ